MARQLTANRLVLKVGTSTLSKSGTPNKDYIERLAGQVASMMRQGMGIVIVTSGAIGAGSSELGLSARARDVTMRQATAAIGQGIIMKLYHDAFERHGTKVAQVLLTYDDFSNRKRYVNLKNTLNALLRLKVVPIINENDPVSIDEIGPSFGDNDRLSALVASKTGADLLIIMSDIDGLYDKDPRRAKDARLIPEVSDITRDIESFAGRPGSGFGLGGMQSKILAVKLCMRSGVPAIICNGKDPSIVSRILSNEEVGTLFIPRGRLDAKRRWILAARHKGIILVDEGAKRAILHGKNLLPAGIIDVKDTFSKGDVVSIECRDAFAKAIVDYSSEQLRSIMGKKSIEIEKILGQRRYENVVRRENLVFL